MSRDGFYSVHFQTPGGMGSGVVTLLDGLVKGGDSILYYSGSYKLDGDNFSAEVLIDRHSSSPNMQSVFGIDRVHIALNGKFSDSDAVLTGSAKEAPNVPFSAKLRRIGQ
jgi:T3SS negative regulator,GrlR